LNRRPLAYNFMLVPIVRTILIVHNFSLGFLLILSCMMRSDEVGIPL
jgi:hypothetical protein